MTLRPSHRLTGMACRFIPGSMNRGNGLRSSMVGVQFGLLTQSWPPACDSGWLADSTKIGHLARRFRPFYRVLQR